MTSEQRKALREALIAQGFERYDFSNDIEGTGEYTEWWKNGDTEVTLDWGKRD